MQGKERDTTSLLALHTLNAIEDAVFWVDGRQCVFELNYAAAALLERKREQVIGARLEVLGLGAPDKKWQEIHQQLSVQKKYGYETKVTAQDGRPISLEATLHLLDSSPQSCIACLFRNVSAREQIENMFKETLAWQESIIEGSRDAIFICNADAQIIMMNDAASELTGYAKARLIGMRLFDLYAEADFAAFRAWQARIFAGDERIHEVEIAARSGGRVEVEFNSRRIVIAGKPYIHTAVRDISARKRAEAEIQSLARFPRENPNPVMRISRACEIIYANERSAPLLESAIFHANGCLQPPYRELIDKAFASGTSQETEVKVGDCVYSILLAPIPETGYVTLYGRDVTQRKRAEDALRTALQQVEQLKNRLQAENIYLQEEIQLTHNFEEIISDSREFKKALAKVEQVAETDATVLILGETGTGKELIARAVHSHSARKERPLVKVNCAALPANLIESELFGHEKGAFTGALARKIGRFELADGGTIFLDEIGDLPLDLQAKLLRVLQEGEFERLGSAHTTRVDVRVIAATNRDLERALTEGLFREDLYYRLNVFPVLVPPLRERKEDIPLLVSHFLAKYCTRIGRKIDMIPQAVLDTLMNYAWPGNVRELEHVIERAVIGSPGRKLSLGDWLPRASTAGRVAEFPTLEEIEREYILKVLEKTRWRLSGETGAAKILGEKRTTLQSRMKRLGIQRPA